MCYPPTPKLTLIKPIKKVRFSFDEGCVTNNITDQADSTCFRVHIYKYNLATALEHIIELDAQILDLKSKEQILIKENWLCKKELCKKELCKKELCKKELCKKTTTFY